MRAPVAGVDYRPVALDDLAALRDLIVRADRHDRIPRVVALDEVEQDFTAPYLDRALDTRAAVTGGRLAGAVWIWNPDPEAREDRAVVYGTVDPQLRRRGIGGALLDWAVARCTERMQARSHDFPRHIRVFAYEWLEDRHRLLEGRGFDAVRWFEELIRPLDGPLPDAPVPDGVTVLTWPEGRDEELRTARNDAFADHWGSSPLDPDVWGSLLHGHGARTDLSAIAVDDATGDVVGVCLNHAYPEDDEVTGRRDAWIENLSTARTHRGRGLASALIARSLAAFAAAGFTHAVLGVDAASQTGANRLYRNLGFDLLHREVTYQRDVSPTR